MAKGAARKRTLSQTRTKAFDCYSQPGPDPQLSKARAAVKVRSIALSPGFNVLGCTVRGVGRGNMLPLVWDHLPSVGFRPRIASHLLPKIVAVARHILNASENLSYVRSLCCMVSEGIYLL